MNIPCYYKLKFTNQTKEEYFCTKCEQVILKGSPCIRESKRKKRGFTTVGVYHIYCQPYEQKLQSYNGKITTVNGRLIDKNS